MQSMLEHEQQTKQFTQVFFFSCSLLEFIFKQSDGARSKQN